jgi:hypothetical protein
MVRRNPVFETDDAEKARLLGIVTSHVKSITFSVFLHVLFQHPVSAEDVSLITMSEPFESFEPALPYVVSDDRIFFYRDTAHSSEAGMHMFAVNGQEIENHGL